MARHSQLFVGRLPLDSKERDIEDLFGKYGSLVRCNLKYGTGMAYAFVDYEDKRDAERNEWSTSLMSATSSKTGQNDLTEQLTSELSSQKCPSLSFGFSASEPKRVDLERLECLS